jgi:type II secretory pathway pseudopilin PulG
VRGHFAQARTGEAVAMIQAIRAAQEGRRAETGQYLNCSTTSGPAWYPAAPDGEMRAWKNPSHPDAARWVQLSISRPEGTRFGYATNAGLPEATMPAPVTDSKPTWPTPKDLWYVIQAVGDNDGDGITAKMVASSLNGELYVENEQE